MPFKPPPVQYSSPPSTPLYPFLLYLRDTNPITPTPLLPLLSHPPNNQSNDTINLLALIARGNQNDPLNRPFLLCLPSHILHTSSMQPLLTTLIPQNPFLFLLFHHHLPYHPLHHPPNHLQHATDFLSMSWKSFRNMFDGW